MSSVARNENSSLDTFPAFEYAGPGAATSARETTKSERPIRFPHIPTFEQAPPGAAHYLHRQDQSHRIDPAHPLEASLRSTINATTANVSRDLAVQLRSGETNETREANAQRDVNATQIEQIAEYLRRKRNEIETEQTDLQLLAWRQQLELLQEKEQLRGKQLNIQMVQATTEILRRQMIEFGEKLSGEIASKNPLHDCFEGICQAYSDLAQATKLLDSSI